MKKRSILFWSIITGVVAFSLTYGLHDGFRAGVNAWVTQQFGPQVVAWGSDISNRVTSTPQYQQWHPLIWVFGGVIMAYGIHQIHAANKIPLFRVKPTQAPSMGKVQVEPEEPESEPPPRKKAVVEEQPPQQEQAST